jgi:AraC-like DNA-binding protein
MIRFGAWSTTLGMAAGFGTLVALLLLHAGGNRPANRLLAALLGVAVLRLMPYVIGFAGFYDAYPWLSFAPFDLALAIGPLLYLYIRRLAEPAMPRHWPWHLAPACIDLGYTLWAFALPLASKLAWNDNVHERWIAPLENAAALLSLCIYAGLALRLRQRYLAWLAANASDRDVHRQPWMASVLALFCLWLAACLVYDTVDRFLLPLNYYQRFPQYLLLAAIVVWLGLEGWRQAGTPPPQMHALDPAPEPAERDWASLGQAWQMRVQAEGWWRQPGLTVADVARHLGTNDSYVSRAFNQGLGRNFNGAINAMRVAAVQQALLQPQPGEMLALALACGFSSKASFNRVFHEHAGMSPTAWRKAQVTKTGIHPASGTTAPQA